MTEEPNSDSKDVIEEKRRKIREILPGVVKEGKIDVEKLKELIGEEALELGDDKYDFSWAGQKKAYKEIKNTTRKTLKPLRDRSVNFDDTENIFIEGENLDTLKTLQRAYSGKVKMIYIDPPYNTGSDFVYEDDFSQSKEEYEKETGQRDEEGKLVANTESNGRFHSDWLSMMYPRLFMARNMLQEDGVIFVSIDDNEFHNLRHLMDDIYGEENFLATFVWKRRSGANDAKNNVSTDHEYIVAYTKNPEASLKGVEKEFKNYSNPDDDPRGEWTAGDLKCNKTKHQRPNLYYDIKDPETGRVFECNPDNVWRYKKETMEELIEEGKVLFPDDDDGVPKRKRFKSEVDSQYKPVSTWIEPNTVSEKEISNIEEKYDMELMQTGLNGSATRELKEIFDAKVYDYPKSVNLIKQLIEHATDDEDIIMDFFAGSGTTGQAVLEKNKESNSDRKFICVQLAEEVDEDSTAYREGYENIAQIATDRLKKVTESINGSTQKTLENDSKYGFKSFRLSDTNFVEWSPPEDVEELKKQMRLQETPWKPDSDKESVIFEILLKEGFTPNAEISEVENLDSTYEIQEDERELFICLKDKVDESIADELEIGPEIKFVCKDSALTDTSKQNLSEKIDLRAI